MKQGKTLTQLAQEIERRNASKLDFIADTRALNFDAKNIQIGDKGRYAITDHTHGQIAARLNIPKKYYDRMQTDAPALLINNVRHWFDAQPERRMIRTLDGNARAFLSDRYRKLDNFDLCEAILPIILESDSMKIISCDVTDKKLYIKALFPKLETEIKKGDAVQSGIVISNSEIGLSSLRVEPLVYRLVCLNGLISKDYGTRKYHVGRACEGDEAIAEIYRDETLQADDKAFWLKVQDIVIASMSESKFKLIVDKFRDTQGIKIINPIHAVEVVANKFTFNHDEKSGVLRSLIQGADLSGYGLINAVTDYAKFIDKYDRATEFERIGGSIIELPKTDWQAIAQAA